MPNSSVRGNALILLIAGLKIARLSGAVCLTGTCTSSAESSVQLPSLLQQNTILTAPAPDVTSAAAPGQAIAPELPSDSRAHFVDVSQSSSGTVKSQEANPLKESMPMDIVTGVAELVNDVFQAKTEVDAAEIGDLTQARDKDSHIANALIDRDHNLIMGWSARAACTATVTMFFENAGWYQSQEQKDKYPWVHDYRVARGHDIQPKTSEMDDSNFLKFKITRNPYRRAVSNWVHQVETNFSYVDEFQALAAKHNASQNSSFLQWLRFVNTVGASKLDDHSKPQFSEWERAGGKYDLILQLESPDFDDQLSAINEESNSHLKFVTMHVSSFLSSMTNRSRGKDIYPKDDRGSLKHPPAEELYKGDTEAVELVKQIYKEDFDAYGYSMGDIPVA